MALIITLFRCVVALAACGIIIIFVLASLWIFLALALSGCAPARLVSNCVNRTIGCS
jgi:hypothetical protein